MASPHSPRRRGPLGTTQMISIRRAVAGDAQKIGAVFAAAVRKSWTYLGEAARQPMFPPAEWDKLLIDHAPQNALLGAIDDPDGVVGLPAVPARDCHMFLLFVR